LFGDATARILIFLGLLYWIGVFCINQSLNGLFQGENAGLGSHASMFSILNEGFRLAL